MTTKKQDAQDQAEARQAEHDAAEFNEQSPPASPSAPKPTRAAIAETLLQSVIETVGDEVTVMMHVRKAVEAVKVNDL